MNGKFPLQPLLDLAQNRMDDAARRLGELIASERDSQQKLDMLQNYRNEYHARFMQAAREGIGPDAWRNFSTFLGRIDEAIASQARLLEQSRHQTAQGQQAWLAQRNKVKAFDTLSQRHQAGVLRSENRREQKMTDEHAAKRRDQEEE
ncbi:flagellar export protein FliJ [Azoarcus sp. TTM-91]|uniref:flagellar export protein FliJ n=1 Tax=Azoarcus sp. TTM-91 TaxID=2691581 RepID=UPI00145E8794|nr:flagellar export protein FliJ [Azoarcus sp. TTM-91]NMG33186.1 flagellar export protein FliJ [Azoarcus sp. TTM-91]